MPTDTEPTMTMEEFVALHKLDPEVLILKATNGQFAVRQKGMDAKGENMNFDMIARIVESSPEPKEIQRQ